MSSRMKGSLVMSFLLIMCLSAGVMKEASAVGTKPLNMLRKRGVGAINSRKLMTFHEVLDYDTGPNPKHDPRGGRRGGAIKSP